MDFPSGPLKVPPLHVDPHTPPFLWHVPGSKSITNRALVLAALSEGSSVLEGVLHSDDTYHMRRALEQMGVGIYDLGPAALRVEGGRSRLRAPDASIFVGNSGTTVRFLSALATLVPGEVTLVGDEHMAARPIQDLVNALRQLGVRVDCPTGCPPLTIHGGQLPGGQVQMPGGKSSQYFSALLMAAGCANGDMEIEAVGELVSRPYVDITLEMMRAFGQSVHAVPGNTRSPRFRIASRGKYTARSYKIEPDASSASYAFAAAAATGLEICVPGLAEGALQGDYAFSKLMNDLGCELTVAEGETRVRGTHPLTALNVDMFHISDTVMTLAAIAPLCAGKTVIRNVANIRIKETDRLAATVAELRRLGQQVEHGEDWLSIEPAPIRPAVVRSYEDHRMAMSFAILGLARPGVAIETPSCVSKTYPGFWEDLSKLYTHCGIAPPF